MHISTKKTASIGSSFNPINYFALSFLVRSNAKHHWLNPTLTHLPEEVAQNMFECLCHCVECDMIKYLILKGQRLNGQIDYLNEDQMHLIVQGLNHSNPDVCQAAFAVICHVKKKGLRPSPPELKASIDFIIDHLTVDDPSFRQCLLRYALGIKKNN